MTAKILAFPQLDPHLQITIRAALELAASEMGVFGQRHEVRKVIATRILRGVRAGERNVHALRDVGLNRERSKSGRVRPEK